MSSILTNRSAITALATLRTISMNLDETSSRVSTGLKVTKASDNANYWTLASTLRSDSNLLDSVSDSIGLGIAAMETASNGIDQTLKVLDDIKKNLTSARSPAAEKYKIGVELDVLKQRLSAVVKASSFNGENWIYNSTTSATAATKNIISSFNRDAAGAIQLNTIQLDAGKTTLVDMNTANRGLLTKSTEVTVTVVGGGTTTTTAGYFLVSGATTAATAQTAGVTVNEVKLVTATSDTQIDLMIAAVDSIVKSAYNMGTTLGAMTSSSQMQQEFLKTLQSSHSKAISALVDADMNEESTRLKALQTQQQLGLQALSIANAESEKLLLLFR